MHFAQDFIGKFSRDADLGPNDTGRPDDYGWNQLPSSFQALPASARSSDTRIRFKSQPHGQRRLANGSDLGNAYISLTKQADQFFPIGSLILIARHGRVEAMRQLKDIFGEDHPPVAFFADATMGELDSFPSVARIAFAAEPGITLTPSQATSLRVRDGWSIAWISKAANNSYTAGGDLEPAFGLDAR